MCDVCFHQLPPLWCENFDLFSFWMIQLCDLQCHTQVGVVTLHNLICAKACIIATGLFLPISVVEFKCNLQNVSLKKTHYNAQTSGVIQTMKSRNPVGLHPWKEFEGGTNCCIKHIQYIMIHSS